VNALWRGGFTDPRIRRLGDYDFSAFSASLREIKLALSHQCALEASTYMLKSSKCHLSLRGASARRARPVA
jgi:hypothetical protein